MSDSLLHTCWATSPRLANSSWRTTVDSVTIAADRQAGKKWEGASDIVKLQLLLRNLLGHRSNLTERWEVIFLWASPTHCIRAFAVFSCSVFSMRQRSICTRMSNSVSLLSVLLHSAILCLEPVAAPFFLGSGSRPSYYYQGVEVCVCVPSLTYSPY